MTRTPFHPAAWVGLGLVAGSLGTSVWMHAQDGTPLGPDADRARQLLREQARGEVYAGADVGYRVVGRTGRTPIVVPVVKLNGEWVEVELGGGGIRKLTQ